MTTGKFKRVQHKKPVSFNIERDGCGGLEYGNILRSFQGQNGADFFRLVVVVFQYYSYKNAPMSGDIGNTTTIKGERTRQEPTMFKNNSTVLEKPSNVG